MTVDLARKNCRKGEHLSKTNPVACVPNKERDGGFNFDQSVIDTAIGIVTLAVLLAIVGSSWWLWHRRRKARRGPIEGDPASGLPAGGLALSPTLGWGDLGWGSPRTGFLIPREAIGHHIVIAGGTGSGKTNSAELIEYTAAESYRPQIIHFDCKGSRSGMARFLALMAAADYDPFRVHLFPIEPYDGWRGGSDPKRALLGRLLQIQDWGEPFYAAGTKDLLQSVLFGSEAPASSGELIARLEAIPTNGNAKLVDGARARYRGFYKGLGGALDGRWAFEDCDACYIQLEGFGLPSEAVSLGRFLVEDLTHYLADRKHDDRPVLLVLDEFSAISSGADAANLIERAREFGAGVILTTQSYAGLGAGAERVLDAARGGLIVHSLANPEPFTARAGTVTRQTVSVTEPANEPGWISAILFHQQLEMPRHTTRLQEFARIDPNEVRQLPRGEAFVICGGRAQRVSFNRMDLWDENIELAEKEIQRRREVMTAVLGGGRAEAPVPDPVLDY